MIVTVIKAFSDSGHAGKAGERINVSPVIASVLHRRGFITLSDGAYRTAALRTDDAAVTSNDQPATTDPDHPRRRRNYRRRDMVADGQE